MVKSWLVLLLKRTFEWFTKVDGRKQYAPWKEYLLSLIFTSDKMSKIEKKYLLVQCQHVMAANVTEIMRE